VPTQDRLPRCLFNPDFLKEGSNHRLAFLKFASSQYLWEALQRVYEGIHGRLQLVRGAARGPASRLSELSLQ